MDGGTSVENSADSSSLAVDLEAKKVTLTQEKAHVAKEVLAQLQKAFECSIWVCIIQVVKSSDAVCPLCKHQISKRSLNSNQTLCEILSAVKGTIEAAKIELAGICTPPRVYPPQRSSNTPAIRAFSLLHPTPQKSGAAGSVVRSPPSSDQSSTPVLLHGISHISSQPTATRQHSLCGVRFDHAATHSESQQSLSAATADAVMMPPPMPVASRFNSKQPTNKSVAGKNVRVSSSRSADNSKHWSHLAHNRVPLSVRNATIDDDGNLVPAAKKSRPGKRTIEPLQCPKCFKAYTRYYLKRHVCKASTVSGDNTGAFEGATSTVSIEKGTFPHGWLANVSCPSNSIVQVLLNAPLGKLGTRPLAGCEPVNNGTLPSTRSERVTPLHASLPTNEAKQQDTASMVNSTSHRQLCMSTHQSPEPLAKASCGQSQDLAASSSQSSPSSLVAESCVEELDNCRPLNPMAPHLWRMYQEYSRKTIRGGTDPSVSSYRARLTGDEAPAYTASGRHQLSSSPVVLHEEHGNIASIQNSDIGATQTSSGEVIAGGGIYTDCGDHKEPAVEEHGCASTSCEFTLGLHNLSLTKDETQPCYSQERSLASKADNRRADCCEVLAGQLQSQYEVTVNLEGVLKEENTPGSQDKSSPALFNGVIPLSTADIATVHDAQFSGGLQRSVHSILLPSGQSDGCTTTSSNATGYDGDVCGQLVEVPMCNEETCCEYKSPCREGNNENAQHRVCIGKNSDQDGERQQRKEVGGRIRSCNACDYDESVNLTNSSTISEPLLVTIATGSTTCDGVSSTKCVKVVCPLHGSECSCCFDLSPANHAQHVEEQQVLSVVDDSVASVTSGVATPPLSPYVLCLPSLNSGLPTMSEEDEPSKLLLTDKYHLTRKQNRTLDNFSISSGTPAMGDDSYFCPISPQSNQPFASDVPASGIDAQAASKGVLVASATVNSMSQLILPNPQPSTESPLQMMFNEKFGPSLSTLVDNCDSGNKLDEDTYASQLLISANHTMEPNSSCTPSDLHSSFHSCTVIPDTQQGNSSSMGTTNVLLSLDSTRPLIDNTGTSISPVKEAVTLSPTEDENSELLLAGLHPREGNGVDSLLPHMIADPTSFGHVRETHICSTEQETEVAEAEDETEPSTSPRFTSFPSTSQTGIIKEESQPLFSSADMCCTQHPTPATSSDSAPLLHGNDPNGGVSCGKQDMHTWTADDSGTTPFANLESQDIHILEGDLEKMKGEMALLSTLLGSQVPSDDDSMLSDSYPESCPLPGSLPGKQVQCLGGRTPAASPNALEELPATLMEEDNESLCTHSIGGTTSNCILSSQRALESPSFLYPGLSSAASLTSQDNTSASCPSRLSFVTHGLDKEQMRKAKAVAQWGNGRIASSFNGCTTHVILAASSDGLVQPSVKYLQGLAAGVWTVAAVWIEECFKAGRLLPESAHEIRGDDLGHIGTPERSRIAKGTGGKLFAGTAVRFHSSVPVATRDLLAQTLEIAGAHILSKPAPCPVDRDLQVITVSDADKSLPFDVHEGDRHVVPVQQVIESLLEYRPLLPTPSS